VGGLATAPDAERRLKSTIEVIEAYRKIFGLDQPLWIQYLKYLGNVIHFNFGYSLTAFPTPVSQIIAQAIPWSLGLLGTTVYVALSRSLTQEVDRNLELSSQQALPAILGPADQSARPGQQRPPLGGRAGYRGGVFYLHLDSTGQVLANPQQVSITGVTWPVPPPGSPPPLPTLTWIDAPTALLLLRAPDAERIPMSCMGAFVLECCLDLPVVELFGEMRREHDPRPQQPHGRGPGLACVGNQSPPAANRSSRKEQRERHAHKDKRYRHSLRDRIGLD